MSFRKSADRLGKDMKICFGQPAGAFLHSPCRPTAKERWIHEKEPLAYCVVCYGHPHLHRQCLCLECPYPSYYAGYGIFSQRYDVDLFPGYSVFRAVCRLSRQLCPENRTPQVGIAGYDLFLQRHVRYSCGIIFPQPAFVVPLLWGHRRYRPGNRLYYTSFYPGQMVP